MDTQTLNLLPWNTSMRANALLGTGVVLSVLAVAWPVTVLRAWEPVCRS